MTAHKHASMIKAKADNMELVVFTFCGEWTEVSRNDMPTWGNDKYFLCLPQHKEACLHWLNGGDVKVMKHECNVSKAFFDEYTIDSTLQPWNIRLEWMSNCHSFRIKPRKEKRWIAVKKSNVTEVFDCSFLSEKDAIDALSARYWQFIEIEVEI